MTLAGGHDELTDRAVRPPGRGSHGAGKVESQATRKRVDSPAMQLIDSDRDFFSQESFVSGFELAFVFKLTASLIVGYIIGSERELRGKPSGISTHGYVIAGAMLFWFAAAIGMAIGYGWYLIAGIATLFSIVVPRLPRLTPKQQLQDR